MTEKIYIYKVHSNPPKLFLYKKEAELYIINIEDDAYIERIELTQSLLNQMVRWDMI